MSQSMEDLIVNNEEAVSRLMEYMRPSYEREQELASELQALRSERQKLGQHVLNVLERGATMMQAPGKPLTSVVSVAGVVELWEEGYR